MAGQVCELDGCDAAVRRGRRFCSREHGYAGQRRPGRVRGQRCVSGRHLMSGENVRTDKRGHRSCRACAAIADRARAGVAGVAGVEPRPRRRRSRPRPVETVRVVSADVRPWRPAGFAPVPDTRVGARS